MGKRLEAYQALLAQPLSMASRLLLVVAVLAIPFVYRFPMWTMSFESNQYPDPLRLAIRIDSLEGQRTADRDDLREINSLNHYIGMRPLLESDFSEFLWMPFAMGFFGLLILRAVVIGNLKDLTDVSVVYAYFALFSGWNFFHRLYLYGHNLDPEAPIKVQPFTPPMYGRVKIANFHVESYPGGAAVVVGIVGALLLVALVLAHVQARRRRAAGFA